MTSLQRFGAWLVAVTSANAGGAVYGAIMVGVLFAAESSSEGYPATIEAAAIVLVLYWLTNLYTHTLGIRLRTREPLTFRLIWSSSLHELPIVEGALIPLVVLLIMWAAGLSLDAGITAALWTAAVTIVVLEVVAGLRAHQGPRDVSMQTVAGALIGLSLVGLKLVLH